MGILLFSISKIFSEVYYVESIFPSNILVLLVFNCGSRYYQGISLSKAQSVLSYSIPNVSSHLGAVAHSSIVKMRKRFAKTRENVFKFVCKGI